MYNNDEFDDEIDIQQPLPSAAPGAEPMTEAESSHRDLRRFWFLSFAVGVILLLIGACNGVIAGHNTLSTRTVTVASIFTLILLLTTVWRRLQLRPFDQEKWRTGVATLTWCVTILAIFIMFGAMGGDVDPWPRFTAAYGFLLGGCIITIYFVYFVYIS